MTITYEDIKEYFTANFQTGEVFTRATGRKVGAVQCVGKKSYFRVTIKKDGKYHQLYAHRVIYALYHGKLPDNQIDHIDGDSLNNAISNLRDVTAQLNLRNRAANRNASIYGRGVRLQYSANGKPQYWIVSIGDTTGTGKNYKYHRFNYGTVQLLEVQMVALNTYARLGYSPLHYEGLIESITSNPDWPAWRDRVLDEAAA